MKTNITIDQYLKNLSKFVNSDYGKLVREQFADNRGDTELAMLVAPTPQELADFKRAVAIMTPDEKTNAANLTDEQVQKIAADAQADPANIAIFFNGYILHCKRVS
jgi:hypothetical protein